MTEQQYPGHDNPGQEGEPQDSHQIPEQSPPTDTGGDAPRTPTQPGLGWPAATPTPAYGTAETHGYGSAGHDSTGDAASRYDSPGYDSPGYDSPGYDSPGYDSPGYPSSGATGYPGPPTTGWNQWQQPGGYQQATAEQPAQYGWAPTGGQVPAPEQGRRGGGRLKIGVAGLVAGALIGGGAGAGVVSLLDDPTTQVSASGASTQNVVIKDPTNATTATAAAAKAAPSVVTIYVSNGQGAGSGSGVVLSPDGYVLTNNHVVTLEGSGTGTVQVRTPDGKLYDADVVGTDSSADLAVVKLKGASGLRPATFADSDKVQVGDLAVAIGAPLGLSNTVTDGIISATNRAVATGSTQNDSTVIDALQTDAAINPGNSGGALVNASGEVVGINTAIASVASATGGQDAQSGNIGVGFAIPSNTAQRIGQEIVKTGKATHAVLGVSARTQADGNNPEAGTGAEIVQVQPKGPAEAAGLKTGDVITAVGDRVVTSSTELTAAIRSSTPGGKVTLTVRRGSATEKVSVTLASTS